MAEPAEHSDAPPKWSEGDKLESATEEVVKFSPEEEAALVAESNKIKAEANTLYSAKDYENALSTYEDAISSCPNYLHYDRAVLQSNMAACHLQLEQWKEAIKIATNALDGLVKLDKTNPEQPNPTGSEKESGSVSKEGDKPSLADPDNDVEEEIISSGASRAAPALPKEPEATAAETRKADILRIRTKALLRRARARAEAGGWQNLAGAEEDYKTLSTMTGLGPADMWTVRSQLKSLPPRTKAAQEKEMSEMWGKLKTLGDGMLKPFGLSTNNFQMVQDEKTGGYSMNFNSGGDSSKSS